VGSRIRRARVAAWLIAVAVSGCAHGARPARDAVPMIAPPDAAGVQLAAVEGMTRDGRHFAALAHLDALPGDAGETPRALWLRAEALRLTRRSDAAVEIYERLLETDWAGRGHHGLGLIAAEAGDLPSAIGSLRRARALRPTDGRVRNDLGYALLLWGEPREAHVELATAVELSEPAGARNLLLLLCATGELDAAGRLLEAHPVPGAVEQRIRGAATRLVQTWTMLEQCKSAGKGVECAAAPIAEAASHAAVRSEGLEERRPEDTP
jgi:Flp pilus assembly protein TadD